MEASAKAFNLSEAGFEGSPAHMVLRDGQSHVTSRRSVPFEIPASQEYFWRPQWQAGEQEAAGELRRGDFLEFDTSNPQGVIDWLHED